jgi:hypothetical protein
MTVAEVGWTNAMAGGIELKNVDQEVNEKQEAASSRSIFTTRGMGTERPVRIVCT